MVQVSIGQPQRNLLCLSAVGLLICAFGAFTSRPTVDSTSTEHESIENPPPPHQAASGTAPQSQLYIAVMDTAYGIARYHCRMKRQWMDRISELPFVDGLEFYSLASSKNPNCTLPLFHVPPRARKSANPSSFLLYQILQLFLARSDADWLFLIGDAAYVNFENLKGYLREWMSHNTMYSWARGSCVERRYYFQMLSIQSGILITRKTVEELLARGEMWDVTIDTGLPADEALSQVFDDVGVVAKASREDRFLGQPFRNHRFYDSLIQKKFDDLKVCERPDKKPEEPGIASVCSGEITQFKSLVSWAGGGKSEAGKEWFLEHAEEMLNGLPDSVNFIWDRLFPELCQV
jgi:hypothetical protein